MSSEEMLTVLHIQDLFVSQPYAVAYTGSSQLQEESHMANKRHSATQDFEISWHPPGLLQMIWTLWRFSSNRSSTPDQRSWIQRRSMSRGGPLARCHRV